MPSRRSIIGPYRPYLITASKALDKIPEALRMNQRVIV